MQALIPNRAQWTENTIMPSLRGDICFIHEAKSREGQKLEYTKPDQGR